MRLYESNYIFFNIRSKQMCIYIYLHIDMYYISRVSFSFIAEKEHSWILKSEKIMELWWNIILRLVEVEYARWWQRKWHFLFSPRKLGKIPILTKIVSDGLVQPPTSMWFGIKISEFSHFYPDCLGKMIPNLTCARLWEMHGKKTSPREASPQIIVGFVLAEVASFVT